MNSLLIALQFLTIIPVTCPLTLSDRQLAKSTLFYPLIGLFIGGMLYIVTNFTEPMPLQMQAVVVLCLWVLISGALHLDGLADCADAWVGGLGDKQRSLQIMKDPAAGPVAVVVLILLLMLKWTLIVYSISEQALTILLLAPMLGRLAILMVMLSSNYIRLNGLGSAMTNHLPRNEIMLMCLFCLLIALYYIGYVPVIIMFLALVFIVTQANKRLGGVTGDVYGATVELVEVSVLAGSIA